MKKIFLLLAAACVTLSAAADEGMWMLPYLQKMNSKDMKARGCKLSAEEIYSMNNSSLKDAIVIFGGGCTGEIVSPDGLLFTNHHCGYGSIQSLSSVEHDYLKNGFWAMSRAEELPAPGLKVRFIRRIVDVTPDVLGAVPDIAGGGEREELVAGQVKAVSERLAGENPGMDVEIKSFFGGNQYFAFVIEVFRDVRLVGAPPTSIGKFGGDTDNWMWPRHTGDFSVFRVYAGPDNRPADYSPENRPYKAEKFLKISLGGYDEGDFAMIMGFPGSTQRYMTSYEIDRLLEVENPQRIFIRGERQAILKEDMAASAKVRIQYASKYAQSSNYWKNSIGKRFGGDTDAYVDYLYDNSVFADERKALAAAAAGTDVSNDPAVLLNKSYTAKMRELAAAQLAGKRKFADGQRLYIAGLMRMQPNKAWASDANFTLRLTYGRVLPYDPADGIHYNYYTTLKGVMEKENPQNPTEFTVPEKLKELYAARDFGRYANAGGELPVAFLADCDITGGNSGSPVMNARGALLGLAFDGNWEAMSGDVAFEPDLQRTISVDIRYVLFIIDKFAGAGWLLDELVIE